MAVCKIGFLTWVLFVIVGILISGGNFVSSQGQCDFQALQVCWDYVKKEGDMIPPSPECCNAIKNSDVQCICQHLPPAVCPLISMKKVAYVAEYCKKPLSGQKCGCKIYKSLLNEVNIEFFVTKHSTRDFFNRTISI